MSNGRCMFIRHHKCFNAYQGDIQATVNRAKVKGSCLLVRGAYTSPCCTMCQPHEQTTLQTRNRETADTLGCHQRLQDCLETHSFQLVNMQLEHTLCCPDWCTEHQLYQCCSCNQCSYMSPCSSASHSNDLQVHSQLCMHATAYAV